MSECISCIKDGKTGVCRDIKDKRGRELLAEQESKLNEVIETLNALSGTDGGHLATDEDITNLQDQLNSKTDGRIHINKNKIINVSFDEEGTSSLMFNRVLKSKIERKAVIGDYILFYGSGTKNNKNGSYMSIHEITGETYMGVGLTKQYYYTLNSTPSSFIFAEDNTGSVDTTEIEQDISDLQTSVSDHETRITALEQNPGSGGSVDTTEIEQDISDLQTIVSNHETVINNLPDTYVSYKSFEGLTDTIGGVMNNHEERLEALENNSGSGDGGSGDGGSGGMTIKSQKFSSIAEAVSFMGSIGIERVKHVKLDDTTPQLSATGYYYDNTTNSYATKDINYVIRTVTYPLSISETYVNVMALTSRGSIMIGMGSGDTSVSLSGPLCTVTTINSVKMGIMAYLNTSIPVTWKPTVYYFE